MQRRKKYKQISQHNIYFFLRQLKWKSASYSVLIQQGESWHTWQRKWLLWRQSTEYREATVLGLSSLHNFTMQKRKIFTFLSSCLAKQQQHYHKTLRLKQFPFSKSLWQSWSLCGQVSTLCISCTGAWRRVTQRWDVPGSRDARNPVLLTAHSQQRHSLYWVKGDEGCMARLLSAHKKLTSAQQQIIGISSNFIHAVED